VATKDLRAKWIKRLDQEEKAHKNFRDEAEAATNAFFANSGGTADAPDRRRQITYPLFWSTIKVLHGRIYSQPPKPDVRKRYADASAAPASPQPGGAPTGQPPSPPVPGNNPQNTPGAPGSGAIPQASPVDDNKLAQCLERGLSYTIDTTDFDNDGHMAVNDLLVTALGTAKVELVTETEEQPVINPVTGVPIMFLKGTETPADPAMTAEDQMEPATQDVIVHQELNLRHFSWSQFRWEPQQHWSQVGWVAFDHWMTADDIEDQFGVDMEKDGGETHDGGNNDPGDKKPQASKYKDQFRVNEIWDKKKKERLFVCEEYPELLSDPEPDPLDLKDFFPCPKPMMLNVRGDDLVPQPDYTYCASMFDYCNNLNNRIALLTKQIKDMGFYDAGFPELQQLTSQTDGNLIPVANLGARISALGQVGKSGYDALVAKQDNSGKVEVVQSLMQLGDLAKAKIWEIYGVSDIQRGSTDPNETATAQNIKAEWANVRVGERIRIVALFFRDVFRIMGELLAEKFQPDILERMTGIRLSPEEMEVLRSDYGRCYAVDVESDSTVVQDEYAEKQSRLEFLNTVTAYIEKIMPAIQQNALPADLAKDLLLFAINTFKDGRQLEQSINQLPGTMAQLAGQQQKLQQFQQQVEQLTKQTQTQAKQLQQVNMGKEQRDNALAGADVQQKQASTLKTQVDAAKTAQDIHESSYKPVDTVVPIRPGQ
jgi:hypothetical protein